MHTRVISTDENEHDSNLLNSVWKLIAARMICSFVCIVSIIVMLSWDLGWAGMTSLLPGLPSMKMNTAFGMCLLGLSLLGMSMQPSKHLSGRVLKAITSSGSLIAFALAVVTILEMTTRYSFGINELLSVDVITVRTGSSVPGRMSPSTVSSILLLAVSISLYPLSRNQIIRKICTITSACAISMGLIAGISIIFLKGNTISVPFFASMALHTSWFVVLIGVSFLFIRTARESIGDHKFERVSAHESTWIVVPTICVFFCGILITGFFSYRTSTREIQGAQIRFDALSERVLNEAKRRVYLPVYGLKGARGMYAGSESVTREEFRAYVDSRDLNGEFPGTIGMGFIVRVNSADLAEFADHQHELTGEPFDIKSNGDWDTHYIITYIEPQSRNLPAMGYDVGSEQNRRKAVESAIETGLPTLTAQIDLVQDDIARAGFLFLVPVYNNGMPTNTPQERSQAILGLVYSAMIIDEIFAGVINATENGLVYSVYEGDSTQSVNLLYSEDQTSFYHHDRSIKNQIKTAQFVNTSKVTTGGQTWTIQTVSTDNFDASVHSAMPTTITSFGLIFSTMASCFVWVTGRSRSRALDLVRSRTEDLRNTAGELKNSYGLVNKKNEELAVMADRAHRVVDDVSHEFRTPLSVIREFSSIIADGLAGEVSDEQAEYLKIIDGSVIDLNNMVEDLLDSSKLRAGRLRIHRCEHEVQDILDRERKVLARKASSRPIVIREDIETGLPRIFVDEEKVRRVISNLMTNAIKFSPEGGEIVLSVKRSDDSKYIEFSVADNGPGLSPDDVDQLFGRFHQVSSARNVAAKGFGLGLSIAHELSWLNLGSISVKSSKGEGATFSFTVPIAEVESIIACFNMVILTGEHEDAMISILSVCVDSMQKTLPNANPIEPMEFLASVSHPTDLILDCCRDSVTGEPQSWLVIGRTGNPQKWINRLNETRDSICSENPTHIAPLVIDLMGTWDYPHQLNETLNALSSYMTSENKHAA